MLHINGKWTPYPTREEYHPQTAEDTEKPDKREIYMKIIGNLSYTADSTRPALSFMVGTVGSAMATPKIRHWHIVKATLRYLWHRRNFGLQFRRRWQLPEVGASFKTLKIGARSDADWANGKTDRRSIKGGFIRYHGIPIGWLSHRKDSTALSTAEAKYRPMADIIQRSIYTQTLARSFHDGDAAITLENDNIPALDILKALGATKRSKFIDMRNH